ncbi:MAG: ABC transporter ATP-binding protein [Synergistaceae bacterium]|jgi:ABC-type nitrate/sulfonate/bicarbonate transport system ATPase subunit|nr:ABC transporter ATP-binding protein [Synergistaceae bacterium]
MLCGEWNVGASIEIRGVSKVFEERDKDTGLIALDNINAGIIPGEFVSILGASGCGKSTLLRIIAGLDKATSGTIYCDGELVMSPNPRRGLVFQEHTLFPWMTVRGNIEFALKSTNQYREKQHEIAEWLNLADLESFAGSYPHQLSGGMRQRASLVRTLAVAPDVVLLDEPLGALDNFTRMTLQDELIRLWRERRSTMIMVTHDVDEAIYLSQRVILMSPRPGRVKNILDIPMNYPRDRASGDFMGLRVHILKQLEFAKTIQEDYTI